MVLVEEEASGLAFKGCLDFTLLLNHRGGMFWTQDTVTINFYTYEVFLGLGSAHWPAATLMAPFCVH